MDWNSNPLDKSTDRDRAKDTGMAMVLICLLVAYYRGDQRFLLAAIVALVIDMVWPGLFHYPSKAWFGLAHLMGSVVSRIILTALFFGVVAPVGIVRRMLGADPMRAKQWKDGDGSVFVERDHKYEAGDIEQPY
jgi:hypothetical protein